MTEETETQDQLEQTGEVEAAVDSTEKPAAAAAAPPDPQADVKRALEAAQRIASESKQEREAYLRTIQNLVAAGGSERREAQVEESDPEVDEQVAKYVERKLDKKLASVLGGIEKTYQTDRQGDLTYRAQIEEERAAARHSLDAPTSPVKREEVRDYLAQLPVEYRGNPQIVDEAYYAIRGRKAAETERLEAGRAASVASSARTSGAGEAPRYTPEERAFIGKLNPSMTDSDLKVIGRGPVSIEDYKKSKAKAG